MEDNDFDTIQTKVPTPPLQYKDAEEMNEKEKLFPLAAEEQLVERKISMAPDMIRDHQGKSKDLREQLEKDKKQKSNRFIYKSVENVKLIHKNGLIYVPETLTEGIIDWYHCMLCHPGEKRLENTIRSNFTWPDMRGDVHKACKYCHVCQISKKQRKKYGLVPEKKAEEIIWNRVNVDLWGPATIENKPSGKSYQLHVMTMIDPVSGWFEIAILKDGPTAAEVQRLLDSQWLARYPRPAEIGFDGGSEFKAEFLELCENMGLKPKPSGAWNPQSNSSLERVHQVVGNTLRTFDLDNAVLHPKEPFEEFTTATAYAIRCSHHQTLGATPAQLVFGRDMILPTQYVANWEEVRRRKQKRIADSNQRENKKRLPHEYTMGDMITLNRPGIIRKLSIPRRGPYSIEEVHNNGTATIKLRPYVTDRVNIRRVQPYFVKEMKKKVNNMSAFYAFQPASLSRWQVGGNGS